MDPPVVSKRKREDKKVGESTKRRRADGKRSSSSRRRTGGPVSPGVVRAPKDYVVVGGQRVYLNFIHAKRPQYHGRGGGTPLPHSFSSHNPFVKESTLLPRGSAARGNNREPTLASVEQPPAILELRNQIIESEAGRARCNGDDADDFEFSIEEFTPPAEAARKRKAEAAVRMRQRGQKEGRNDPSLDADTGGDDEEPTDHCNQSRCESTGAVKSPRSGHSGRRGEQPQSNLPSPETKQKTDAGISKSPTRARSWSSGQAPLPTSAFAASSKHRTTHEPIPHAPSRKKNAASSAISDTPSSTQDSISSQNSDGLDITSSFLASVDVLENSATGRWNEEETLPTVESRTELGGAGQRRRLHREGLLETDSQWIDSPLFLSTQAARALALAPPSSQPPSFALASPRSRGTNVDTRAEAVRDPDECAPQEADQASSVDSSPLDPSPFFLNLQSSPLPAAFSLLPPRE